MSNFTHNEMFFCFEDVKRLFHKHRFALKRIALYSGCAVFFIALLQEPTYKAQATFKQSQSKNNEMVEFKNLIKNAIFMQPESSAMSIMRSQRLMRDVMQEMGWQMQVPGNFISSFFARGWNNFLAELRIPLADRDGFEFRHVRYEGEKAGAFFLEFTSPTTFVVSNHKKVFLGEGKVGEVIDLPEVQFTLVKTPPNLALKKAYCVAVEPWTDLSAALLKRFEIKSSKIDKDILQLTFVHRNRHRAADFLNQVMLSYQGYLKQDDEQAAKAQLTYLDKRQSELLCKLDHALTEHVSYMKTNLGEEGFIGLNQEIDLLSGPKEEYTARLFNVDLRLKRFQNSKNESIASEGLTCQASRSDLQQRLYTLEDSLQRSGRIEGAPAFDGPTFDLKTTKRLHFKASQELDEVQTTMRQLLFLKGEMQNPEFELTSLTAILSDSVSNALVQKASQISLELKDLANRGIKDVERLNEALATQKRFILNHISQMVDIYKLRSQLLEQKIQSLSQSSVDLLCNEKKLIEGKLDDLRHKMATLPEKWRLENELKLKKDLTLGMIEGMTQLVESKNINHHLRQIESKPLDLAFPALKAQSPHLLSLSCAAALLGAFSLFGFYFGQAWMRGLPVSCKNLEARNRKSCGLLTAFARFSFAQLQPEDLETLRRIAGFVDALGKGAVSVIGPKEAVCVHHVCQLLAMQGKKILLVEADFQSVVRPDQIPGLWQYLEAQEELPLIRKLAKYDFVPTGGTTRHATELLKGSRFSTWLSSVKTEYDCVLLFSPAHPASAEAHVLLQVSEGVVVALGQATAEDLSVYETWQEKKAIPSVAYFEIRS